jgi:uncharacterized protein (TIGR02466 family)
MKEQTKSAAPRSPAQRLRPAADTGAGGRVTQERKRWIEASKIISMFPSMVWKFQLEAGLRDALNANIEAALADLRRALPPLEGGHGWQSGHALHRHDELRELVSCVERGVTSILRFLRIGHDVFEITGCWATVLAKGAAHKAHSHPNNFLSGVYYVRTDDGADRSTSMTRDRRPP